MIENTFVINPVRPDYIERCLYTLREYTSINYRIVIIDQTYDGIYDKVKKYAHLYLRPHRNLGFAKSMNEGIVHGLHWESKYITCLNDDVEFINGMWWGGILDTFNLYNNVLAVNPMSSREPGWGYGLEHGKYIDLIEYKENYTVEDYNYLLKGDFSKVEGLPKTYPRQKNGVIDAIATWCTVFHNSFFKKIGLFDERYYPGGGEDYDMDARCYRKGYRMVGTTLSWAWHWWGSSKDKGDEYTGKGLPVLDKYRWCDTNSLWPPESNNGKGMDPWGHYIDENGERKPMNREEKIGVVEI